MTAVAFSQSYSRSQYSPVPAQGSTAGVIELAERRALAASRCNRPVPPPFDCLNTDLAYAVTQRWHEPCEAAFEFILGDNPRQLAQLIVAKNLRPGDLTFAAEILGRSADSQLVRSVLVPLLQHAEAVVREGAIYGLTRHLDDPTKSELRRIAESDRSAAVRMAAEDALVE